MAKDKKFLGIAIIPIFLLLGTSFMAVGSLFLTYSAFYIPDAWEMIHWEATPYYSEHWDIFVYYRIFYLIFIATASIYLFINGFEKQKSYPRNYILFMIIALFLFAIDVGFTYYLPVKGLMSYYQIHGKMIFHSIVAVIFTPYFAFSKTVKKIFIH